jgi:anti-sigma factor RsiW
MIACSHEGKIDAYLMGKLSQAESDAFEDHYFNCPSCFQKTFARNELVDVIKYKGASIFAPEEEERRPVAETPKIPIWDRITAFLTPRPWVAVAAAAILLVVIVGVVPRSNPSAPVFTAVEDMTVRGAAVETLSPAGEQAQAPAVLAWKAIAGAAEYRVSVFKGSELVWSATAAGADVRIALPESLVKGLSAGPAYAWQVKAYSAQGTLVSASARTEFTIAR